MAFRETIEAVLKVKDANRFKAGMESAARSVRKLGRNEEETAAQTELLKSIEAKLQRQTEELTVALRLCAASIDNVGDQAIGAAASMAVFNRAAKQSGSNAVFMGKSWAFWKDRLSLTRSELMTTALTIGTYFAPAILALGSSFVYAAIGGGGVAAGGLATLVFGLAGLATVVNPVVAGLQRIKKAQDEYNVTVQQYGAASVQTSRASAHLYAIIQTSGGAPAARAAANITKLANAWKRLTAPARGQVFGILGQGLSTARALAPGLAMSVNQMAVGLRAGLRGVFRTLQGGELRQTFRTLSETFDRAIGPGLRGATNVVVVFSRVLRATAPWVVKFARAWARVTESWRERATMTRVQQFFDKAVVNFQAWWALALQLGRTLKIIFGASHDEGLKIVTVLTNLVRKFNDWLQAASDSGKIQQFWQTYNQLAQEAVWALQHPIDAINKWLPRVMDAIATGLVTHAPRAAEVFIRAFLDAGAWAKLLTVAWFMKKFGFFGLLGSKVAGPFLRGFITAVAPRMAAAFLAEGAIGAGLVAAGTTLGGAVAASFAAAWALAPIVIPVVLAVTATGALAWLLGKISKHNYNPHESLRRQAEGTVPFDQAAPYRRVLPSAPGHHRQFGGLIKSGDWSYVGEAGPEIAYATPRGTAVQPLRGAGTGMSPTVDLPNLQDKMHFTIYTSVQVDRREIARAVNQQEASDAARRGGRPRNAA